MTKATATPPSWASERWTRSTTTSASCQDRPPGAASAFARASFAANRAASDSSGRTDSSGVKTRSRRVGVRSSACSRRAISTTSVPRPMITCPTMTRSLDGDGLGQVSWLVDVVTHNRGQLAGEELEWDGGHDRLQQGGYDGQGDREVGVRRDLIVTLLGQHERARTPGP